MYDQILGQLINRNTKIKISKEQEKDLGKSILTSIPFGDFYAIIDLLRGHDVGNVENKLISLLRDSIKRNFAQLKKEFPEKDRELFGKILGEFVNRKKTS